MIEIKLAGDWPETAIQDITEARSKIDEFNLDSPRVLLIGPKHLLNNLDARYEDSIFTYMSMLRENGLIRGNIRVNSDDMFAILYAYSLKKEDFPKIGFETAEVKLTNIRSIRNKVMRSVTCSKCDLELEVPRSNRWGDDMLYFICRCGHENTIQSSARKCDRVRDRSRTKVIEKDTREAVQPTEPFERPAPPGTNRVKNNTEIFGEGYLAGYNQALVDKGFMTQEEADKILRSSNQTTKVIKE